MTALPLTPDFEDWRNDVPVARVQAKGGHLLVEWADGKSAQFHALLLAENDPAEDKLHPKSRETLTSPLDFATNLTLTDARITDEGAVEVEWSSDAPPSRFHPGWLRGIGWFSDEETGAPALPSAPQTWDAALLPEPPTFDGPAALVDPKVELAWLEALARFGIARLEGLPQQDGLLEDVVTRIGPVRESNFGRQYTLEIKDDPDSNAFTSEALLQHIDMPTRESPHGLQFLYCRANTTSGGEGVYCDGFKIAEDIRRDHPEFFESLTKDIWLYNNRARTTDYRAEGPIVQLDARGAISAIRYTPWLRAPLKAPLAVQDRAYKAFRCFTQHAQDERYWLTFRYRPGDLLCFDNRRALHGRLGYDAKGGERFIEGIYSDRDDLFSRIRMLRKETAA